jgi:hypothetical protein
MLRFVGFAYLCLCLATSCRAQATIAAGNLSYVVLQGRTFPVGSGLGLSYLGGGLEVTHTGNVLRLLVAACDTPFKLTISQGVQGFFPWQSVVWIPASAVNETITLAAAPGTVIVQLNAEPPEWFSASSPFRVLLSLTTDVAFVPAGPAPSRVLHFLGDSITAATNVRGGFAGCADYAPGFESDYSSSWAGILCGFFGASCSTIAIGGKGLVKNCCGDTGQTVPDYYQT